MSGLSSLGFFSSAVAAAVISKIPSPTLCIIMVTGWECVVPAYEDLPGEIVLPAPLLPVPVSASVTARPGGDTGSCHLRSNYTEQAHIGQSRPQVEKEKIKFPSWRDDSTILN